MRIPFRVPPVGIFLACLVAIPSPNHAQGIGSIFRPAPVPEHVSTAAHFGRVLDDIEDSLRCDGTIVIQQPSVWGQARMTMYRRDFEDQMKKELSGFQFILSAKIARSDQATLESQTALAASLTPLRSKGNSTQVSVENAVDILKERDNLASVANTLLKQNPIPLDRDATLTLLDKAFRSLGTKHGNLGLEPTVYLDQEKRYLDHLNEIRRINTGDDTADSAGYGLYLVRMPVSIEPGHRTHQNHGAMLTVTAHHDFGPCYLQNTFRNLVINDLIDELTPTIFNIISQDLDKKYLKDQEAQKKKQEELLQEAAAAEHAANQAKKDVVAKEEHLKALEARLAELTKEKNKLTESFQDRLSKLDKQPLKTYVQAEFDKAYKAEESNEKKLRIQKMRTQIAAMGVANVTSDSSQNSDSAHAWQIVRRAFGNAAGDDKEAQGILAAQDRIDAKREEVAKSYGGTIADVEKLKKQIAEASAAADLARQRAREAETARVQASSRLAGLSKSITGLRSTTVRGRDYPVAPTDVVNVFLVESFIEIATATREASDLGQPRATVIRNFLRRELEAAYDIMERGIDDLGAPLADIALMQKIYNDVRNRAFAADDHQNWRKADYQSLMNKLANRVSKGPLGPLCWAIAIDAGLLNQHIQDDMQCLSGCNGFNCPRPPEGLFFYLPKCVADTPPAIAAAECFKEYVKTRWPLITFSLDPTVDQQNIADAYSLRRELQLAVAYAFSTGRISFNQLNRFQRRIAYDAETIALNRTVTVFSHGNDTFGWRFTPRYQNPPQERTNLQTITNLALFGGPPRNYQTRTSKLERGQRELTAVIIMPSFLNRIRMDVSSNWFPLTHPDKMTFSTPHVLEQSRRVQTLLTMPPGYDGHQYRPQDLQHLATRAKRIEKMLPIQEHGVPVPYENALGGFELFGQGNGALVPKLVGFEGVDVIKSTEAAEIGVLLYGKSISLQETKVVAGGRILADEKVTILSREVVRLQLPANVTPTTMADKSQMVEVYLATPNGISNAVLIPYKPAATAPVAAANAVLALKTPSLTVRACWLGVEGMPAGRLLPSGVGPQTVDFAWTADPTLTPKAVALSFAYVTDDGKKGAFSIVDPALPPGAAFFAKWENGLYKLPANMLANALLSDLSIKYAPTDAMPKKISVTMSIAWLDHTPVLANTVAVDFALDLQLSVLPAAPTSVPVVPIAPVLPSPTGFPGPQGIKLHLETGPTPRLAPEQTPVPPQLQMPMMQSGPALPLPPARTQQIGQPIANVLGPPTLNFTPGER